MPPKNSVKILGVNGSLRDESRTIVLVQMALEAARGCGAEVELLDLRKYPLPLYEAHQSYENHGEAAEIRQKVHQAQAYIFGSPEYHGGMSGTFKNFLDFHYAEFAGKLAGVVIATGGTHGFTTLEQIRIALADCHAWTLPYHAAAMEEDFDGKVQRLNERVRKRCRRIGRDVAIYGALLYNRFVQDRKKELGWKGGFAQGHAE